MSIKGGPALFALTAALNFGLLHARAAEPPPVEAFARIPMLRNVEISPDGGAFSAKVAMNGREHMAVYEFAPDGKLVVKSNATESDGLRIGWISWKRPDRLVVSLRFPSKRWGTDTIETRLMALAREGGEFEALFRHSRDDIPLQMEDQIISWLPNDPDHILVEYNDDNPREPAVYRVPIERNIHRQIQGSRSGITGWIADPQGRVRAGYGFTSDAEKKQKLILRLADEAGWRDFSHRVEEDSPSFAIMGFAPDGKTAYVESDFEQDAPPVYEFDIEKDSFGRKVFEHPNFEASGLRFDSKTGALTGIDYVADETHAIWLDEGVKSEIDAVRAMLPGKTVELVDVSLGGAHAVLFASSADDPGRYYFFNRAERRLTQLPANYPELQGAALGKVIATSYAARDGLAIPAYVTLPPGVSSLEEARGLPFVVNPHGGPGARDFLSFDYWAQFFASRGYGVLQMNFRGSTGYGTAFKTAGEREWGQAMQDDIADGADWLAAQGYADRNRIAIVGGSYGGYAALMGAAKTPDLYQCAVSFAGVSDLPDLLRDARKYIGGKAGTRHIGRLWTDRAMLAENSPARRADDIKIPVLLVHGDKDRVVDVDHSKKMRNALRKAGGTVEYVELKDGDHHLSAHGDRLTFLSASEKFLAGCIGG